MSKKLALIVEDSIVMRNMISHTLCEIGFDIIQAESGYAALRKIHNQKFDLVVTDIFMEEMDGIELISHLRKKANFIHVPIITLTGENNSTTKEHALSEGANYWLSKPFNPELFINTVNKICKNDRD